MEANIQNNHKMIYFRAAIHVGMQMLAIDYNDILFLIP